LILNNLKSFNGADFSPDRRYRYKLWRIWDKTNPKALFIMLNPSTADKINDDPTIRRCIGFARSWNFGGILVGNLFAYRSADPKELQLVNNPVGDTNQESIQQMISESKLVVCAWGNEQGAPPKWLNDLSNLHYLELTKDGTPKHPLYLRKGLIPKSF